MEVGDRKFQPISGVELKWATGDSICVRLAVTNWRARHSSRARKPGTRGPGTFQLINQLFVNEKQLSIWGRVRFSGF